MQIQLNQSEIESAVKDYVTKQGISLRNRTVEMVFTQRRVPDSGLTVDLDISEAPNTLPAGALTRQLVSREIGGPAISSIDPPPTVSQDMGIGSIELNGTPVSTDVKPEPVIAPDTLGDDDDEAVKETPPPKEIKKTTSLFGG